MDYSLIGLHFFERGVDVLDLIEDEDVDDNVLPVLARLVAAAAFSETFGLPPLVELFGVAVAPALTAFFALCDSLVVST